MYINLSTLNIACWNIHGLGNKLDDSDRSLLDIISKFDVFAMVETWLSDQTSPKVEKYHGFHKYRPKSYKAKRSSGGISLYVKRDWKRGIKRLEGKNEYILWIKFKKSFFKMANDLYIGAVYIPPKDSPYQKRKNYNPFAVILEEISEYERKGNVILLGDFNGRTGINSDCLDENGNRFLDLPEGYRDNTSSTNTRGRNSNDCTVNVQGKELLDICKATRMRILNGRIMGDLLGQYTCYQPKGCSVVDYGLVNEDMLKSVQYFHVHAPEHLSDHAMISLKVKIDLSLPKATDTLVNLPPKFKWNDASKLAFRQALEQQGTKEELEQFMKYTFENDKNDVNQCNEQLTKIIIEVGRKSLKRQTPSKRKKRWHDINTESLKKDILTLGKTLAKCPLDPFLRGRYITKKNQYHKLVRNNNRKYKQGILDKISEMEDKNPKEFWRLVNTLKGTKEKGEEIDPSVFFDHFKALNEINSPHRNGFDKGFEEKINERLKSLWDKTQTNPILDKPICAEELKENVNSLSNKKSGALDQICNEMFKNGIDTLCVPLLKLFNLVLESGIFPQEWCIGLIVPLFKNGNREDPTNYRGITLSSCMGKLFTKVMNGRLYKFLASSGMLNDYQIGFKKGCGTTNHIFVLKCIIDQAKKNKKKIFAAFIDFQKAFDTVWREGLFYKLLKSGLSTPFCDLLKNMYSQLVSGIKVRNKRTPFFKSEVGTRQGCNLSPWLFNLYINDLPTILGRPLKDSIKVGGKIVPLLMYADDVVLLSYSASGLQQKLDILFKYCSKWKLTVNTKKSKILIFNCRKTCGVKFNYGAHNLEITDSYCYLGIIFTPSGSFKACQKNLLLKARKAYFCLLDKINAYNGVNPRVLMKLFDAMIVPILLYGSELWGLSDIRIANNNSLMTNILKKDYLYEKLHTKFCKRVLMVGVHTTNMGVLAELGRFPLSYNMLSRSIKFYLKVLSAQDNSLLAKAMHSASEINNSWYRICNTLVAKFKLPEGNEAARKSQTNRIIVDLKKDLRKSYVDHFLQEIRKFSKLELYCSLKKSYEAERYLYEITNRQHRAALTKLRLSAHHLPIERLRRQSNTDRMKRYCITCDQKALGDEKHVLLECSNPALVKLRFSVLCKLNHLYTSFGTLPMNTQLLFMLMGHDKTMTSICSEFMEEVLKVYPHEKPK
jgi:exonuclease III